MSAHTPGPWSITGDLDPCIVTPDGFHVLCAGHDYDDYGGIRAPWPGFPDQATEEGRTFGDVHDAELRANARLIAAAPDMLAALLDLEQLLATHRDFAETVALRAARNAISKATGDA